VEPDVQVFWVPKQGNSTEEYEDAYACAHPLYAIADGATESSFADLWANILVCEFIRQPLNYLDLRAETVSEWLEPIQTHWHQQIHWEKLPWYAEEKARHGAFATLLGIEFQDRPEAPRSFWGRLFSGFTRPPLRWRALAVGDSCLFHVRNHTLLRPFPLTKSTMFNPRPLLFCSNPGSNSEVCGGVHLLEGEWLPEDLFLLATDALSCWFLKECETGKQPWRTLMALKTQTDFETLVARLRGKEGMKNDDTTLLRIHWSPSPGKT
jgi:hypothetical protein